MTGLVMPAKATTSALKGLSELPKKIMMFGDSEGTISAMETEGELNIWFGNRVAEVHEHIASWKCREIEVDQLYHWPGASNPADIATKGQGVVHACKLVVSGRIDLRRQGTHKTPGQPPGTSAGEFLRKKVPLCWCQDTPGSSQGFTCTSW